MITENEAKHYLYRHVRLDKNKPFYIGIGTINNIDKNSTIKSVLHRRAFSKSDRNNLWRKIYNKTNIKVEIMLYCDDYNFLKQKEIEFIKLYGRINTNNGTLCNFTNGGDGSVGYKHTDAQRKSMSEKRKIKVGEQHHLSKKVYVYNLKGNYIGMYYSRNQCAIALKVDNSCIYQCLKGKIVQCFEYVFKKEYLGENIPPINKPIRKKVNLLNPNTLESIKIFDSVTDVAIYLKTSTSNVSRACKNICKTLKNHKMKYYVKEQDTETSNIEDNQAIDDES